MANRLAVALLIKKDAKTTENNQVSGRPEGVSREEWYADPTVPLIDKLKSLPKGSKIVSVTLPKKK